MLPTPGKASPVSLYSQTQEEEDDLPVELIAARDLHKVAVFKRFHIDYCCEGKLSLRQSCAALHLNLEEVKQELRSCARKSYPPLSQFEKWKADNLVDYIYHEHHQYYYEHNGPLAELCDNVADHHSTAFPELLQLKNYYRELQAELKWHLRKEENLLFPFIFQLAKPGSGERLYDLLSTTSMAELLLFLDMDHDAISDLLLEMRRVTNNYTPAPGTCSSFEELYGQLQLMDSDLRQHLALETKVLFPKVNALEKRLRHKYSRTRMVL